MLVLALETAVERASVVVAQDARELVAWREDTHQDLCRRLAPEVAQVIARAGCRFSDLDLVAVGLGPGHFTALRVGLATAKAVALAQDLPLVGISSLAAMAWHIRDRVAGLVCPVLDARRGEVYAALYRIGADSIDAEEGAFVAASKDVVERLLSRGERVTLFGQVDPVATGELAGGSGELIDLRSEEAVFPDALAVAQLGRRRFAARGGDDAPALRPIYVRKSYAEERSDIDLGLR